MFAIESFAIETNVLTGELIQPLFGDLLSISNDHSIHSNISSYNSAIFSEQVSLASGDYSNNFTRAESISTTDISTPVSSSASFGTPVQTDSFIGTNTNSLIVGNNNSLVSPLAPSEVIVYNPNQGTKTHEFKQELGAEVELHSGTVLETHSLVSYSSLGVERDLTLTYDSGRASAQPIFRFGYENLTAVTNQQLLMAELTVSDSFNEYQLPGFEGGMGLDGGEHFWSIPGSGCRVDAAMQADMRSLSTGQYNYSLTSGIVEFNPSSNNFSINGDTSINSGKFVHINTVDSPFGNGWSLNSVHKLVEYDDGSVLLVEGDGSEMVFEAPVNPGGEYVSPAGDFSILEKLSDGTFRRTTTDRTVYQFDSQNRLVSVSDRNGNETRHVYNNEGQLVKIVDPVGLETTFTYINGAVTEIIDPTGKVTQFTYDRRGNLQGITDPDGTSRQFEYDDNSKMVAEIDKRGNREQIFYDRFGLADFAVLKNGGIIDVDPVMAQGLYSQSQTSNPFNAPTVWTQGYGTATYIDAENNKTFYNLDSFGQVVSGTDEIGLLPSLEYDLNNLVTQNTSALGYVTQYQYDNKGNLLRVKDEISSSSGTPGLLYSYDPIFNQLTRFTDELGRLSIHSLDPSNGNRLSTIQVVGKVGGNNDVVTNYTYTSSGLIDIVTDPLERLTDYDYDEHGRLIQITYAKGTPDEAVQQFEYDEAGNQTAFIDENGNRTEYKYDEMNRVVQNTYAVGTPDEATELMEYDEAGNLIATIDGLGNRTEYKYDDMGWLIETVSPDPDGLGPLSSPITTSSYDRSGNLVSSVDPLGRETRYLLDERGRALKTIRSDNRVEQSKYDLDNNEILSIDANGNQTKKVYDARQRLIQEIDPLGNISLHKYDAVNKIVASENKGDRTEYQYDDLNRMIKIIDPLDNFTEIKYDLAGNVISQTNSLGETVYFSYDARNRQKTITDSVGTTITEYDAVGNLIAVIDPLMNKTTYTYDDRNRIIAETNVFGDSRFYEYDKVGNQTLIRDRNNRVRKFVYDNLSRNTEEYWLDNNGVSIETITYEYDAAGQLTSINSPDSTYDFTYSSFGTPFSISNNGTQNVPDILLTYAYDNNCNIISLGEAIEKQQEVVTNYIYNPLNRVTQINKTGNNISEKRVDFVYDEIAIFRSVNRYSDLNANNLVVGSDYTYDENKRLIELSHKNNSSTLSFFKLNRDFAERINKISNIDGITQYSYDENNRLINVSYTNSIMSDESYVYDASGNRINSSIHDNGYEIDLNNQLSSDGIFNYEYDKEGNLIRRIEIATKLIREYKWDYRNRLISVVDQNESGISFKSVQFSYDGFNRRITKVVDTNLEDTVDGVATHFVYDRNNVILEFVDIDGISGSKDPVFSKRYLHGSGLDKILAQEDATGEVLWYLSDNSGTIRDIVSNDGAVVNHLVYDSFGNVIAQTNPLLKTRYLFTGREYESEVGLYYYRARYYDSSLGRFISEDPIGFNSGDTNLYTYVLNNPVYYVDPLGTVPRFVGTLLPNTFERLITYVKPNDFVNYTVAFTDNNALTPATFLPSQGASRIIGDNLKASLRYTPGNATTRYPGENLILGIQRGLRRLDDKGHIVPFLVGGNIFNQNGTLNTANFFWQNKFLNMGSYNQYGIRIADAFEANVTTDPATILTYRAELFYNYGSGQFYWDPNNPFRPGAFAAEPTDNRRRPYEAIELTNPISA